MSSFIKAKNAVSKELCEVEMILKNIGKDFSSGSTQEIFEYFLRFQENIFVLV